MTMKAKVMLKVMRTWKAMTRWKHRMSCRQWKKLKLWNKKIEQEHNNNKPWMMRRMTTQIQRTLQ